MIGRERVREKKRETESEKERQIAKEKKSVCEVGDARDCVSASYEDKYCYAQQVA